MKELKLNRGLVALVDDDDYERLSWRTWMVRYSAQGKPYAVASTGGEFLHRVVMNAPKGSSVDHADENGLNNQKENLRYATKSQNAMNRGPTRNNKFGLKGVSMHQGKYRAQIQIDGKKKQLGLFSTPEAAHAAYCEAAQKAHGAFCRTESRPIESIRPPEAARYQFGSSAHSSKLTESTAQLALWMAEYVPQSAISRLLGVKPMCINALVRGRTWTHIPRTAGAEPKRRPFKARPRKPTLDPIPEVP